jgi:hypothetical protein
VVQPAGIGDPDAEPALPVGGEMMSMMKWIAAQTFQMARLQDFCRNGMAWGILFDEGLIEKELDAP